MSDKKGWFDNVFKTIVENKTAKDSGKYNAIPFGLPSLDKHIRIIKGVQYIITANTGVGKTQLAKALFVNQPYKFIKENPNSGIKLKILYFALEESKQEFMLTLIANRLQEKYGITTSVLDLMSYKDNSVSESILEKIKETKEYFEELSEVLEVYDHISNPFGIYKTIRDYARANGKFFFKGNEVNIEVPGIMYDQYVPNNPDEYVITMIDHGGLLQTENTSDTNTLHGALSKLSAEYLRKNVSKHFNYIPVLIMQQAAEKEKLQFTLKGESVEQKLEPSLDGIANNKEVGRDALVVFGLFAPDRYKISNYLGYNIEILGDHFRSLHLLKNRRGLPNLKKGLFFDGATNVFKELPNSNSEEMGRIYSLFKNT